MELVDSMTDVEAYVLIDELVDVRMVLVRCGERR